MIVTIEKPSNNITVTKQAVLRVKILEFNVPSGIQNTIFTQKGSLLVGTGAGTYAEFPPGADGEFLQYDSNEAAGVKSAKPTLDVEDVSNGLINGGHDIAQRQTPGTFTGIGSSKYSSDRWRVEWEFPSAAANWQASYNYALNNVCKPTVYNGFYYKVTTDAGSSGASQPTWPTTPGATVVDGGITWTCMADVQYARQDGSAEAGLTSPYYGQWKRVNNAGKFLVFQPLEYMDTLKYRGRTIIFQNQLKASSSKTLRMAILELQSGGTADSLPSPFITSWNADSSDPTFGSNIAVIATAESKAVGTSMAVFSFSGTFPSTSKNLLCAVWTDSDFAVNDTFSQAEAGLHYGSQLQSWSPLNTGKELDVCTCFTEVLSPNGSVNPYPGIAFAVGGTDIRFVVNYKRKRKSPTITINGLTGTTAGIIAQMGGSNIAISSVSSYYAALSAALIIFTSASSGTAGQAGALLDGSNANSKIVIDSELY